MSSTDFFFLTFDPEGIKGLIAALFGPMSNGRSGKIRGFFTLLGRRRRIGPEFFAGGVPLGSGLPPFAAGLAGAFVGAFFVVFFVVFETGLGGAFLVVVFFAVGFFVVVFFAAGFLATFLTTFLVTVFVTFLVVFFVVFLATFFVGFLVTFFVAAFLTVFLVVFFAAGRADLPPALFFEGVERVIFLVVFFFAVFFLATPVRLFSRADAAPKRWQQWAYSRRTVCFGQSDTRIGPIIGPLRAYLAYSEAVLVDGGVSSQTS